MIMVSDFFEKEHYCYDVEKNRILEFELSESELLDDREGLETPDPVLQIYHISRVYEAYTGKRIIRISSKNSAGCKNLQSWYGILFNEAFSCG